MKSVSHLTELLDGIMLREEVSPTGLGFNRRTILDRLKHISNDALAAVWLLEKHDEKLRYRLSYLVCPESIDLNQHRGIVTSAAHSTSDKNLQAEVISSSLAALSLDGQEAHPLQTERLFNVTTEAEDRNKDKVHENDIGLLVYAEPSPRKLNEIEAFTVKIVARDFSNVVSDSRLRRLVSVEEKTANLNGFSANGRSVASTDAGEHSLADALAVVSERLGTDFAYAFSVDQKTHLRLMSRLEGSPNISKSISKLERVFSQIGNEVCSFEGENLDNLRNALGSTISEVRNAVIIPVLVPGRSLKSPKKLQKLKDHGNALKGEPHLSYLILLLNKSSPEYLGEAYSGTDIQVATIVSRKLATVLSSQLFQARFSEISKLFEGLEDGGSLENKKLLQGAVELIPDLAGLTYTKIEDANDGEIDCVSVHGNKLARAENSMIRRGRESVYGRLKRLLDGTGATLEYLTDIEESDTYRLVFHLPTKQTRGRLLVFNFRHQTIPHASWELIKHFVQEAHLLIRHNDAMKERAGVLAQIRHAIIGPLSHMNSSIELIRRAVVRSRRSSQEWEALREDNVFLSAVQSAGFHGSQAFVLIDSARVIFRGISPDDLKRNTRIYPVEMLGSIRTVFDRELSRKRLQWNFSTNGNSTTAVFGDHGLMWITMYNLIDNAVKYATPNTVISIVIQFDTTEGKWEFSVQNTGGYLSETDKDLVLAMYERGRQEDILNRRSGTGVGLPVANQILAAHSPRYEFDYSSIQGTTLSDSVTTFWFNLPIQLSR